MKRILLATTLFFALAVSGCLDTEESIQINPDNTGVYSINMDMGNMIKMMKDMGQSGEKKEEKKDSTIYFNSIIDTASNLTKEEKELLRDGSLRIKVDTDENEMFFNIKVPFKNVALLPKLRSSLSSVLNKTKMMNKLDGSSSGEEEVPADLAKSASSSTNPTQEAYTLTATPGKLKYTLTDKKAIEKIAGDSSMQMMQTMSAMMGGMNYSTKVVLPRPVKKYTGNNIQLSADKKTVTLKTTLSDMISRPESMEYEIEY